MTPGTLSLPMPASSRRGLPYLAHVHSFRAIAIIAVVATHVIDYLRWENSSPVTKNVALSIFQNGSVLFVFIAGLLFQYLSEGFNYRRYLVNKLRFVVAPYVVASIPTLVHQYVRRFGVFSPSYYDGNWGRTVLSALLKANHLPRPLWFIPMIVCFYLVAPLFLWLDRKARSYFFVLPISLVMAGFAHRPIPLCQPLHAFVYFLPAYLAGMATGRFHSRMAPPVQWLGQSWLRWSLTVLAVTFVPLEVWVLGRGGALWSAKFFDGSLEFDTNLPFKLVLSLATLSWLAIAPKGINRRLFLLAELSFGIFFIHEYVLQAFCRISGGELPGSLLHVMAGTVSVTVTSLGVVVSTKRLTGKWSRYLVGC